jgi:hypothetical protein
MCYRNLLHKTEDDVITVLNERGDELLEKLKEKLDSPIPTIVSHTIYVISSIASGS